jgi:thiomorpholine-carboxylate dehydrogenase
MSSLFSLDQRLEVAGFGSRESALKESGDVIVSGAHLHAEAGETFSGARTVPASDTTVFKSVGLAIGDLATARLVYDLTLARPARAGAAAP